MPRTDVEPEGAPAAAAGLMTPPTGGAKIRMYRHGLGDCFLLAFPARAGRPFYFLVDCGVILGTPDASRKMQDVVRDIAAATGGRIDVAAATHEHWDHISGFAQAAEIFQRDLKIGQVWLAWTEDKSNPLARKLIADRHRKVEALRGLVQHLQAAESPVAGHVTRLLDFFGGLGATSTGDALDAVRGYSEQPLRYCRPADPPAAFGDVPGLRTYVLGPPEDEQLLNRDLPTKTGRETYDDSSVPLNLENAFLAAALHRDLGSEPGIVERELQELSLPFDRSLQIPVRDAKRLSFFRRYYFGSGRAHDLAWRQIDNDWLNAADQIALKLDSDTNNTSLVLAFELTVSGRVLLFAADAQVGNWLSWGGLTWKLTTGESAGLDVTAQDLLARTVLYKVGHHGSHNATLRAGGLELMRSPDLMALIPVDSAVAQKKKWDMPFPPLVNRLREKTSDRILRSDDAVALARRQVPEDATALMWSRFQKSVVETDLYFEITIADS